MMKRELGIARCGLACCLCSKNETCNRMPLTCLLKDMVKTGSLTALKKMRKRELYITVKG